MNLQNVKLVLERAAEMVEEGWCKGWPARTENDGLCCPTEAEAVKFSIRGAMIRAYTDLKNEGLIGHAEFWRSDDTLPWCNLAVDLIASRRRGCPGLSYWTADAYNNHPLTRQSHCISLLKEAMEVAHLAPKVPGCNYETGWWREVLEEE